MVKKIISVVVSVLAVLATIAIVGIVLIKTGIINWNTVDSVKVYVNKDENGLTYTSREWVWKPTETKEVINYVDTKNVETQTVSLHISDVEFYDIKVPTGNIIYDYGKTIWAEDGSYLIRVVGDINMDTLSKAAGIDNGLVLDKTTISSPDGKKGSRVICTLIGDTAIIANIYKGSETYSVIRDSFMNNKDTIYMDTIQYSKNLIELKRIAYTGEYVPQVHFSEFDLNWVRYLFAEGELSVYTKYDRIFEVEEELLAQLCVFAQTPIDEIYRSEDIIYARAGNWYVGLLRYNTNTTVVLFGSGEEAKCNIIALLDSIK